MTAPESRHAVVIVPAPDGQQVTVHAVPAYYADFSQENTPDGRVRLVITAPAHLVHTVTVPAGATGIEQALK